MICEPIGAAADFRKKIIAGSANHFYRELGYHQFYRRFGPFRIKLRNHLASGSPNMYRRVVHFRRICFSEIIDCRRCASSRMRAISSRRLEADPRDHTDATLALDDRESARPIKLISRFSGGVRIFLKPEISSRISFKRPSLCRQRHDFCGLPIAIRRMRRPTIFGIFSLRCLPSRGRATMSLALGACECLRDLIRPGRSRVRLPTIRNT